MIHVDTTFFTQVETGVEGIQQKYYIHIYIYRYA